MPREPNYGRSIGTATSPSSTPSPGSYRPAMSLAIPLDDLAEFEGSKDSPVVMEAAAPDRTVVRWEDRATPQSREYETVTPVNHVVPGPRSCRRPGLPIRPGC